MVEEVGLAAAMVQAALELYVICVLHVGLYGIRLGCIRHRR